MKKNNSEKSYKMLNIQQNLFSEPFVYWHKGGCSNSYLVKHFSGKSTTLECSQACASVKNVGFFTYKSTNGDCSCYLKEGNCQLASADDTISYQISPGIRL